MTIEQINQLPCVITHVALSVDDSLWMHDKWIIAYKGVVAEFSTGIGHRVVKDKYSRDQFKQHTSMSHRLKQTKANLELHLSSFAGCSKPVSPKLSDVIYSMLMDSSACEESYDDWCSNYGYDTDSRKALETYLACQDSGKKLRQMNIASYSELTELFQDY